MSMSSCFYKDMLGVPGKGVHTHVYGIAIIDVVMTIVGAVLLTFLFKWNFIVCLVVLFLLGILLHRVFCVRTTIDKLLFKN